MLVKTNNATPLFSTSAIMVFLHWMQLLILLTWIRSLYKLETPTLEKNLIIYLLAGIIVVLYHFLVIVPTSKKWFGEFRKESDKGRNNKRYIVLLFTVGSIVLFFLSLVLLKPV